MKEITKDWLKVASDDIAVARIIINQESLTQIVAFHCQQAIEKYLKAIIEERTGNVPKVHNLSFLLGLVEEYIQISIDEEIVESLDSLYIEGRYPGEIGLLPNGRPSLSEAGAFLSNTELIQKRVLDYLA